MPFDTPSATADVGLGERDLGFTNVEEPDGAIVTVRSLVVSRGERRGEETLRTFRRR
jgi:hypothetical protein